MLTLMLVLTCGAGTPSNETLGSQDHVPAPERQQVEITDRDLPVGLTKSRTAEDNVLPLKGGRHKPSRLQARKEKL